MWMNSTPYLFTFLYHLSWIVFRCVNCAKNSPFPPESVTVKVESVLAFDKAFLELIWILEKSMTANFLQFRWKYHACRTVIVCSHKFHPTHTHNRHTKVMCQLNRTHLLSIKFHQLKLAMNVDVWRVLTWCVWCVFLIVDEYLDLMPSLKWMLDSRSFWIVNMH